MNTLHTARRVQGTRRVAPILEEGKSMKLWWNVAMPALVAGVLAVGAPTPASAQGTIKMDGSSTVFPIAEALAEEYQISKRVKEQGAMHTQTPSTLSTSAYQIDVAIVGY